MSQAWTAQPERGSSGMMRLMVRIALGLGWWPARLLTYPITLYFLLFSTAARRASAAFLERALRRRPTFADLFRHYLTFASTILDRVFLLTGRTEGYRIEVSGLELLQVRIAAGQGCLLLGSHLGSFEVLRALADQGCPVPVKALMYEENAVRLNEVLAGLSRRPAPGVIRIGTTTALLQARDALAAGELVGILGDRVTGGDKVVTVDFLGRPATLPAGPVVLAAVLAAPVILFFGLHRGPRHYEIRFLPFAERITLAPANRQAEIAAWVQRYAQAVEATARAHPYNWFNFYDFWASPRREPRRVRGTAPAATALAFLLGIGSATAAPDLQAVMQALAAVRESRVGFREEREMAALATPLVSHGTLFYRAPAHLEKHTTGPVEETITVDGERLTWSRPAEGASRELSLDQVPELRGLVEAIRGTLAGDLTGLRRYYEVGFETLASSWRLTLVPVDGRVRMLLKVVRIEGEAARIRTVETEEPDGDRTRLTIDPPPG